MHRATSEPSRVHNNATHPPVAYRIVHSASARVSARDTSPPPIFIPRPIILQALERSHKPQPKLNMEQDNNQYITLDLALKNFNVGTNSKVTEYALGQTHPTTMTPEQANLLLRPNSACSNSETNYHKLNCGHIVLTSTAWPTTNVPKSACASNCKRHSPISSVSTPNTRVEGENSQSECFITARGEHPRPECSTFLPFVCPMCIEISLRRNYIRIWKEYRSAGYHPSPEVDVNVAIWTYCVVRAYEEVGLRVTQGTSGVFLLGHKNEYDHISFLPSIIEDTLGRWTFRGRKNKKARSRSRSPGGCSDEDRTLSPDGTYERRWDRVGRKNRERSPLRRGNSALDELAERLGDAKVGLLEDGDVDGLLVRMTAIPTDVGNYKDGKEKDGERRSVSMF